MSTTTKLCEGCDGPLNAEGAENVYTSDDGLEFCCEGCYDEWRNLNEDEPEPDWDDDGYLIDGVGFADPGGISALRAATPSNPRNLPCPNCGQPNRLTPLDRAQHYVCDVCADQAERGGY